MPHRTSGTTSLRASIVPVSETRSRRGLDGRRPACWPPQVLRSWQSKPRIAGNRRHVDGLLAILFPVRSAIKLTTAVEVGPHGRAVTGESAAWTSKR